MPKRHQFGVTSIQNAGGTVEEMALFDEAQRDGDLKVRTYSGVLHRRMQRPKPTHDRMVAPGSAWATTPGAEVRDRQDVPDGVIESRTAAMLAPYANSQAAGAPNLHRGRPRAHGRDAGQARAGRSRSMRSAIGPSAMSLDALEHAASMNPAPARGRRHRLEHIEAVADDDIARFGKLGVIASQQPMHVALGDMNPAKPSGPWPDNVGPERCARGVGLAPHHGRRRAHRLRQRLAGGPARAGQGIWLADHPGAARGTDQTMPMADAIDGYTRWPAYASFEEQRKGTLAPGMLADIAVLSSDIFARPPQKPTDLIVDMTIANGAVVYRRDVGR